MTCQWTVELLDPKYNASRVFSYYKPRMTIGRAPEDDLSIPDGHVSRGHVTLEYVEEEQACYVEDQRSRNGTFIKDGEGWRRLEGRARFSPPATLRIGSCYQLQVNLECHVIDQLGALANRSVLGDIHERVFEEAIMVLDMCGSSQLSKIDEKIALHLKKRLEQICAPVLRDQGLRFYKSTGDGFLAAFAIPTRAVCAAVEILRKLAERNRGSTNPSIHVRIALHYGRTYQLGGDPSDLHGSDVNLAFRLENLQNADLKTVERPAPPQDRVLCTSAFRQAFTRAEPLPEIRCTKCGVAELKGFDEPVEVFWCADGPAEPAANG